MTKLCGPTLDSKQEAKFTHERGLGAIGVAGQVLKGTRLADTPFLFERIDAIGAPEVLLPSGDKVVREPNIKNLRGNDLTRAVIRDNVGVARYLAPPRVSHECAEWHSIFDDLAEPTGAFVTQMRLRSRTDSNLGSGGFPDRNHEAFSCPLESDRRRRR